MFIIRHELLSDVGKVGVEGICYIFIFDQSFILTGQRRYTVVFTFA